LWSKHSLPLLTRQLQSMCDIVTSNACEPRGIAAKPFFVIVSRHSPKNSAGLLGANAEDVERRRIQLLVEMMRKEGLETDGFIRILTSPAERCRHAGRLVMMALEEEGFQAKAGDPETSGFCSEGLVYSAEAKVRVLADTDALAEASTWYERFFNTVNEMLVAEGLEAVEVPGFSGPNLEDLVNGSWKLAAIYNARACCEEFQIPEPKSAMHARVHQLLANPARCSEEVLEGLNSVAYAWYALFHANAQEFAPAVYSELLPLIGQEIAGKSSAALFIETHDPILTVLRQALGVNWAYVFDGERAEDSFVPFMGTLILEARGDALKVFVMLPSLQQMVHAEEFELLDLATLPLAVALAGLQGGRDC